MIAERREQAHAGSALWNNVSLTHVPVSLSIPIY